jgi:hypothetical protein
MIACGSRVRPALAGGLIDDGPRPPRQVRAQFFQAHPTGAIQPAGSGGLRQSDQGERHRLGDAHVEPGGPQVFGDLLGEVHADIGSSAPSSTTRTFSR